MGSLKDRIRSLINRHRKKQQNAQASKGTDGAAESTPQQQQQQTAEPAAATTPAVTAPATAISNGQKYFSPQSDGPASSREQPQVKTQNRAYNRADVAMNSQAATATSTLQVALVNNSSSSQVYAYITGLALDNNNAVFLLQSDAQTAYYPSSPSTTGAAIGANVSIPLGAPGNTVTATIPRLAGARIWFSIGTPLQFFLNPGPGLVEPSVFNQSDPNYNTNFSFCEFTYNTAQVFVNISYVDFVSNVPIALTLDDTSGSSQHVSGMSANGLATVTAGLRAQTQKDGRRWSSLIVQNNGTDLRALSPNSGITTNPSWFQTYWTDYINQVWTKYTSTPLTVDTQASYGAVKGQVNSSGILDFGNGSTFSKPTSADIFSNSTGPFATGSNAQTNSIIPRLAAAFNRSLLLLATETPNGTQPSQYYTAATTNHYARIVHAANVDKLGYSFPYDDVAPDGGAPQEGAIFSFSPAKLTVTVGGNKAYAS